MAGVARSRKSGYTLRSGVMRRESLWFEVSPSIQSSAPGVAVLLASLNTAALGLRPFTVVRTRGPLFIRSDQQAATEPYQAAIGLAVVSDQSVAIGVTAVPTPVTDSGSDLWFVYQWMQGAFIFNSGIGATESGSTQIQVDSRAMRKVEDGQDVIIVQETAAVQSTGSQLLSAFRILIKLH